jgi:HlyD family secretion protein
MALALATAETALVAARGVLAGLEGRSDPSESALAELAASQATLAAAENALRDTQLRAPFAGVVVSLELPAAQRQTSLGRRTAWPGDQITTGTRVVRVADLSAWRIEIEDLDERSVVQLNEGDRVTLGFDAIPELEMTGVITRIGQYGVKKQGDITYTVVVAPRGNDERLRWSMTAVVQFGQGS